MKIALLLVTLLFPIPIYPLCSCSEFNSLDSEEYRNYDLIVQGLITSIEENEHHLKTITMEIKKVYKGEVTEKSVKIRTPKRLSYCGLNIGTNSEWIIYGYKREGTYQTNSCTRSSSIPPRDFQKHRVEEDLKFLKGVQEEKQDALEFLNTNSAHFRNIIAGKHETYDNGYVDSLQVGIISSKKAPGIKLFSTEYSREENVEYVSVQELLLVDILEVRKKGNHLDLISRPQQDAENTPGEVKLCMDYLNSRNIQQVVYSLQKICL